jgi:hypothetical protein
MPVPVGLFGMNPNGVFAGFLCLASAPFLATPAQSPKGVEKYQATFAECRASGSGKLVDLRSFRLSGQPRARQQETR